MAFPFSNFQPAEVEWEGYRYPTVEHAYQAAKTLHLTERLPIWEAKTPGQAKRLGQHVTLRADWDMIKDRVMLNLLRQKFAPGTDAARQLLLYREALVEFNNWHDTYWGVCTCAQCNSRGENHLGKLLEQIRRELRAVKQSSRIP